MTCPTGGAPNINHEKKKKKYGKTGQFALTP